MFSKLKTHQKCIFYAYINRKPDIHPLPYAETKLDSPK